MSDTATAAPPAAGSAFDACKQAFFPILAAHGIARVTIGYNGEGDEGQVNDVAAFDEAGDQVDLPAVDCERHQLGFDGTVASDATDQARKPCAVSRKYTSRVCTPAHFTRKRPARKPPTAAAAICVNTSQPAVA